MHARVTTAQVQPGKIDETIGIFRDSVVPAAQQQKGFKGGLVLTDRSMGKAVVISLWETEANITAGEGSGFYQEQVAKIVNLLAGPPTREAFEVSLQM